MILLWLVSRGRQLSSFSPTPFKTHTFLFSLALFLLIHCILRIIIFLYFSSFSVCLLFGVDWDLSCLNCWGNLCSFDLFWSSVWCLAFTLPRSRVDVCGWMKGIWVFSLTLWNHYIYVFFRCRQVLLNRKRSALDWPTLVHKPLLELKDVCFTDCEFLFWTRIKMASETGVFDWYSLSVLVLLSSLSWLLISRLVQMGLRVSVLTANQIELHGMTREAKKTSHHR